MYGIDLSEILFVKYCRVGVMDYLGEELGCEVICMLVGERLGLVIVELMLVYIVYKLYIGMVEVKRIVILNIYKGGIIVVEVGVYIVEFIKIMLDKKVLGIDFK